MSNEMKIYRVQHSRVVIDTYEVEATSSDEALEAWQLSTESYPIVLTDYEGDDVDVFG